MLCSGAQVVTRYTMGCPGASDCRLLMNEDGGASWGNGVPAEIAGAAVKTSVGGNERVGAKWYEMIER